MKRILFLSLLAVGLATSGIWYATQSPDRSEAGDGPLLPESTAGAAEPSVGRAESDDPRAVVDEAEHHFGTMDALQHGSHKFTVRNEGKQPLTLQSSGTTCRCTVSDVPADSIPPGGSAQIEVRWNTGSAQKHFAQTASVSTNDPKNGHLLFRVVGSVRNRILVEPSEFVFSRVEPDKSCESGVLIYSQVWPKFSLRNFRCTLPGFEWNVERVELPRDDELARGDCYRVSLKTPPDLQSGHFSGTLNFTLVPDSDNAAPQPCELLVSGKVLRRLSVYGPQIDSDGVVDLGLLPGGKAHHATLLVKIRDAQPQLTFETVKAEPDFVQARIEAESEQDREKGIYRLRLTIPANAPVANHWDKPGTLRIVTDHPRIGQVDLQLRFSIIGGRTASLSP